MTNARWPLVVAAPVVAATGALAMRSPHAPGSYGICPSLLVTGWYCPACGGLRAVHELTWLDLAAAWSMNPLVVLGAPVAVVVWCWWLVLNLRGSPRPPALPRRLRNALPWAVLVLALAFAVLRNVPALTPVLGPWP
ncbi:DUF2752 domain-containing protein [Cellulomonas bogoriensis]|nr:DUF2752 domain-containing protein [Cellulomonas bogoriensis]